MEPIGHPKWNQLESKWPKETKLKRIKILHIIKGNTLDKNWPKHIEMEPKLVRNGSK